MQGPRLKTLQNDGVQGCLLNTLQGAWENGVASMWWRRRASADPAKIIPTRTRNERRIRRDIRDHSQLHDKCEMMATAHAVKPKSPAGKPFLSGAAKPHACRFTSLMLEKTMPSARSLV